jgi:hypothetical protein
MEKVPDNIIQNAIKKVEKNYNDMEKQLQSKKNTIIITLYFLFRSL